MTSPITSPTTEPAYPSPLPGEDQEWQYPPGSSGIITKVHFVRHGEVDNPSGRLYGRQRGYKLTKRGEQHAINVARALRRHDITAVYASPLKRAQQTAYPVAHDYGLSIITNPLLIEAGSNLENELLTPKGILTSPHIWPMIGDLNTPSWGEHYCKMAERMLAMAHRAVDDNRGHEAVCVSHQCAIWVLRRFVEEKRLGHHPGKRNCSLGSITTLVFDGDIISRLEYQEPSGMSDPASLKSDMQRGLQA